MTKVERVVYTKVYSTIKQDKNLNSSEKLLLCEIISFNDNGRCTASNGYLGDSLGMKKTAISNAIKELVKKGYIESNTFTEHQNTKRWLKPTTKTMILITDGILIEEPKEEITPELNEAACEEEKEVASLNAEEEYKPKIITEDEIEELILNFDNGIKPILKEFLKGKNEQAIKWSIAMLKDKPISEQIRLIERCR